MNIIIPDYVFKNKYENHFLLTEFDIIFNEEFTHNLNIFFKKLGSKKMLIKLEVPIEYDALISSYFEFDDPEGLREFYEMSTLINGTELFYYMMNFFIKDDTNLWEIYVSIEHELSIIGCLNRINFLIGFVLNPYGNEDLHRKMTIISDKFNNEISKIEFIESLEKNYQFFKNQSRDI
ncbi:hypothetical protein [Gelidibacter japonicus]|uniref:hypothetical protein n=1 Tax=Gelidibacter japonicus TaxID=1962232 RepID=UPI002AFE19BC|nr:hypothetical protein [Gelidibacter japonicus]